MPVLWNTEREVHGIIGRLGDRSLEGKTVLITGGAGFIGSWLCDTLIKQNARVICLDNLSSGLKENIEHLLGKENFRFINHDVSEPLRIETKVDYVMHLASRASPLEFEKYPLEILKSNTLGLMNALEVARRDKARLLFTSTSEIYGEATIFPTPETHRGYVNTLGIRGCYDEAKRAGEALCMAYLRQYDLDVRIVRIFNTYGPRMRAEGVYGRVIPRFMSQALNNEPLTIFGDGSQTRSFCYITDQVEGLLRYLTADSLKGEVINIGNPHEYSVLDLANLIITMTGSNSQIEYHPLPQDDPTRRFPDISKAQALLQWHPRVSLEDGLHSVYTYYRGCCVV
jgi:UDP-glucuronate decarboxylase